MTALSLQAVAAPPDRYATCYTASKLIHAGKLLDLRNAWPKIHFTARWPVVRDLSTEHNRPAAHWIQDNVDDIIRSENVLVYAEPEDELKGAIFEVGIAWAHDKRIFLVGENRYYSRWKFAPRIVRCPDLESALRRISDQTLYPVTDAVRILGEIDKLDIPRRKT